MSQDITDIKQINGEKRLLDGIINRKVMRIIGTILFSIFIIFIFFV